MVSALNPDPSVYPSSFCKLAGVVLTNITDPQKQRGYHFYRVLERLVKFTGIENMALAGNQAISPSSEIQIALFY